MEILKFIHVSCACLSIAGFTLRGYWMFSESPLFSHKLTKILPHVVDSLLLFTAVAMALNWRLDPLEQSWMLAKIIALIVYIALGMIAFRFGNSRKQRAFAWCAALFTAAYIVQTAFTKNPWVI